MQEEAQSADKTYEPPEIEDLGSLRDLTMGSKSSPSADMYFGEPPGPGS